MGKCLRADINGCVHEGHRAGEVHECREMGK
jgi:hypothetical protein